MKKITHGRSAKESLLSGISAVADAVRITIGPRGSNVVFEKGYGAPTITNDGVSIAKEISLPDKIENMGAEIAKEVATKTNDIAGDGTTTSLVLFQALAKAGIEKNSMGVNGLLLKRGIDRASEDVIKELRAQSKPTKTKEEVQQVATISAESEEIGKIIAETIDTVGKDGVVTVEESQTFGITSTTTDGLEFDKGYVSHYMVTNTERMEAEYKNVAVLVTDKKISSVKEILPLLEKVAELGKKEIVIIAEDVDGEALATLILNKIRGIFSILAVKAPSFGDRKKEELADIAILLGATVVSEETGLTLEKAELSMLGHAEKIIARKDKTIIIGGKGKKSHLEDRIVELKGQLKNTKFKFDKENIEKRIAKLTGGVAVIKVGAATEMEMKYLKLKIEDAVNATKAAVEEGIVPGGGVALVKAGVAVRAKMKSKSDKTAKDPTKSLSKGAHEEGIGYELLLSALDAPFLQIAKNAGHDDASVILSMVKKSAANEGYDAGSDTLDGEATLTDMYSAGILDPVKVTRTALENAASAAGLLLTTEAAITDLPKEPKEAHDHGSDY